MKDRCQEVGDIKREKVGVVMEEIVYQRKEIPFQLKNVN